MINITTIGRLGADAEIKEASNGSKFVSLRMATDDFKGKERVTTWLNIICYNDRELKLAKYLTKGKMLLVSGTLMVTIYETKNGEHLPSIDVRADRLEFISNGKTQDSQAQEATAQETPITADVTKISAETFTVPKNGKGKNKEEPSKAAALNPDYDDLPF